MCVCGAGEGCGGVVWESVVWHGVVLICGVWLSLCVCGGVGEGCDGIVVSGYKQCYIFKNQSLDVFKYMILLSLHAKKNSILVAKPPHFSKVVYAPV